MRALILFITMFGVEIFSTINTVGIVKRSYKLIAIGQMGGWGCWLIYTKNGVASNTVLEYIVCIVAPTLGALFVMWYIEKRSANDKYIKGMINK